MDIVDFLNKSGLDKATPKIKSCKCRKKPKLMLKMYGFKDSDVTCQVKCKCGLSGDEFDDNSTAAIVSWNLMMEQ